VNREEEEKKGKKKRERAREPLCGGLCKRCTYKIACHVLLASKFQSVSHSPFSLFYLLFVTCKEGKRMICQPCFHMQVASHHITSRLLSFQSGSDLQICGNIRKLQRQRGRDRQLLVSPCCIHIHTRSTFAPPESPAT